jgi:CRP-like cAMP-binding protein
MGIVKKAIPFFLSDSGKLLISDENLKSVCYSLTEERFEEGQIVFNEYDPIGNIMVIREGILDLMLKTSLRETYLF